MKDEKKIEELQKREQEMRKDLNDTVVVMNQIITERNNQIELAKLYRGKEFLELDARRASVALERAKVLEELAKIQPTTEEKTETNTDTQEVPENS